MPEPLDPAVDVDLVRTICDARLGSGEVQAASALRGGRYNSTFRLERVGDAPLVLRIAPAEGDQRPSEWHLMRNEVASIAPLSAVADLMPRTLISDFSHEIVPRDYVIQSFLPGTPAAQAAVDWARDDTARLWCQLGQILRKVHTRTGEAFGRVIGPTVESWPAAVAATLNLMADGCDALGLPAEDLRDTAAAAASDPDLAEVDTPHLLHGDLGFGNVMVDADNPDRGITGIFDCDRTSWGDPRADVTFAYVELLHPEQREAFSEGYGDSGENSPQRDLFYRVRILGEARLLHARLGRARQLQKTYDLVRELLDQLR
jgi:aminoglycoside phosphotransferase (APT) family kinase protein